MRVGARRVRVRRSDLDRMLAQGAIAPAAGDRTAQNPVGELRRQLDPALQEPRNALAAGRKGDLVAALSALVEAPDEAIAALEHAASSPLPPPASKLSDAARPNVSQRS